MQVHDLVEAWYRHVEIVTMSYPVSKEHFASLVERALAEVPKQFAEFLEGVPVEIRARPSAKEIKMARLPPDSRLLGFYRGRPLTARSVEDSGTMPDVILIFQEAIEAVCDSEEALVRQVRITVRHEIGHHFGMDEDDLDQLGYG